MNQHFSEMLFDLKNKDINQLGVEVKAIVLTSSPPSFSWPLSEFE